MQRIVNRTPATIRIGKHEVQRRPLPGSLHCSYSLRVKGVVVWESISIPCARDLDGAVKTHRSCQEVIEAARRGGRRMGIQKINGAVRPKRGAL
ncbi:hypothetical protein [Ralstonia chuxiongensis]|uniref:Uncharacterized protein n=1 Tax=Ralstonia chuxiongensis TaxID=2957504 RepID=A0AA41WSW7_9RALS|nr:hypothetical protein [Ralstonia chuxiongensis]MCP1174371.1 hypothetical protein [Ralstonia chuxiongensis]